MDSPSGYNGKLDETTGEPTTSRKQSPHTSPSHVANDLNNGTTNEPLPSSNPLGPGDDTQSGIPSSHFMINGLQTASVPIPYQRMPTNNQQQEQQQQQHQMLLYQQAYVVFTEITSSFTRLISRYQAQYEMMQQAAHYNNLNQSSNPFPMFDYTLTQPQSSVTSLRFAFSLRQTLLYSGTKVNLS